MKDKRKRKEINSAKNAQKKLDQIIWDIYSEITKHDADVLGTKFGLRKRRIATDKTFAFIQDHGYEIDKRYISRIVKQRTQNV